MIRGKRKHIKRTPPIQYQKSEIHHESSKWLYTQDLAAQLTTNGVVKCSGFSHQLTCSEFTRGELAGRYKNKTDFS